MTKTLSDSPNPTTEIPSPAEPPKIPRLNSLEHQLRHAKDDNGDPVPLLDDLLFFLEDPPAGTGDRWQKGADLCEEHGIKTTRMSVWRFYRANILKWRYEQNPPPPPPPADPEENDSLYDQARVLSAQRTVELLSDPGLAPGHLIAFLQNDNLRQKLKLASDQFDDRDFVRLDLEEKEKSKKAEGDARYKRMCAQHGVPYNP